MNLRIKNVVTVVGAQMIAERTLDPDQAIINNGDTLNAGKSGTAGAAGVMTLGVGHGITDAVKVTVKWAAGLRYNCTVASYDSTTVTLSGGTGDTLPTSGAVVVSVRQQLDAAILGTNLVAISIGADVDMHFTIEDGNDVVHLAKSVDGDGAYQWDSGNNEANPITGDTVGCIYVTNRSATAGTLKFLVAYDND